jgi:hypothetical protein
LLLISTGLARIQPRLLADIVGLMDRDYVAGVARAQLAVDGGGGEDD